MELNVDFLNDLKKKMINAMEDIINEAFSTLESMNHYPFEIMFRISFKQS